MKQITLKHLEPDLARALEAERKRRRQPMATIVSDLLRRALQLPSRQRRRRNKDNKDWVQKYAGTWSEEEFQQFERVIADFERIDGEP